MDELTAKYYANFAGELAPLYNSVQGGIIDYLSRAFGPGMRVLDIGSGSGRDVNRLLELHCDAYGVEPCEQMRTAAVQTYPALATRLEAGQLPNLGNPFEHQFDGVLCSAVLMHLPRSQVFDAAVAIRNVLKPNGRLLLSIPDCRPGINEEGRDEHGRLYTDLNADYLELLFERIGFQLVGKWKSSDGLHREGQSWHVLLLQLRHTTGLRPVDQIEGILSRDRKTATYKLALFRALSEIAITEFERARWIGDGVVAVPLDAVSEKWLAYYWPLIASASFIPQIRGEGTDSSKPIAFRASLATLVREYEGAGGLSAFVLDYRGGKLSPRASRLLATAMKQIRDTIVKGPVTFAGGALGSGRVFGYSGATHEILMSAGIWRELSLLGHWIQDAVVLRWAELTSEISKKALRPSEVIDLLLTTPIPERDVAAAKQIYIGLRSKECAWSGKPIARDFHVDHIIPYSLWHNNDLWNLVPALPSVNSNKGDRLPTRDLLLQRRDCLVHYWQLLRSAHGVRFDYEACRLTGVLMLPNRWESAVFTSVAEAVEFTALQRGCERWRP